MAEPRSWTVEELRSAVGQELGRSDWFEVTQERIAAFAEATGDRQWIHLDAARAAAESPFGAPIAHGFLTLSLLSPLSRAAFEVAGDFRLRVNYGANRVRFPAPVVAGSEIRATFRLTAFDEADWGVQVTVEALVESRGASKPCLAAEWIMRAYH